MSALGLPGGWATTGPAFTLPLPAQLLAGAPVPAEQADPEALAGAFRDLLDALAAGVDPRVVAIATGDVNAAPVELPAADLWRGSDRCGAEDDAPIEDDGGTPVESAPRKQSAKPDERDPIDGCQSLAATNAAVQAAAALPVLPAVAPLVSTLTSEANALVVATPPEGQPEPHQPAESDQPNANAPQAPERTPLPMITAPQRPAARADAPRATESLPMVLPAPDAPAPAAPTLGGVDPVRTQVAARAQLPGAGTVLSKPIATPFVPVVDRPAIAPPATAAFLKVERGTDAAAERPAAISAVPVPAAQDSFTSQADAGADSETPGRAFDQKSEPRSAAIVTLKGATPKPDATVAADPVSAFKATAPAATLPMLPHSAAQWVEESRDVSAPSLAPRTVANQIVQSLRLAWSRGAAEAHIRLDPRQFGDLTVEMRLDGREVVVRLEAEAPAVREWLRANQQTLTSALTERDLRLDRLDVRAPGEEPHDGASREGRDADRHETGPHPRRQRRHDGRAFQLEG